MMTGAERLLEIAGKLRNEEPASPISVRGLLSWFAAQRRSYWNVWLIRKGLKEAGLTTIPDFESAYIDSEIRFELSAEEETSTKNDDQSFSDVDGSQDAPVPADPTYRISKLEAANKRPISVNPDASLGEAITVMMVNDFSQLPVMTNDRDTKGIVSWSSIGARQAKGKKPNFVRDAMDAHHEIRFDASMFQAIPTIVQYGYVLIRGLDAKISGIVTASDLSLQFQQLAEPFLLLSEIENHIRSLLHGKFEKSDFVGAKNPTDTERVIEDVSDLTFGEYVRLLEEPTRWHKLELGLDRGTFCRHLEEVRKIRNEVMHFDPDGILREDLEKLRDFARFLQRIQTI